MVKQNMGAGYVRAVATPITSESVTGEQEFTLNEHSPRANIIDYFHFVDGNGDKVAATAGTVEITLSSGADIFNTIFNGSFNAVDALAPQRTKPSGFGRAERARFSFTGVTGAVGFRALITQNVK